MSYTIWFLILVVGLKGAGVYPVLNSAYKQTGSRRRRSQLIAVLVCSLLSDLTMLGVIFHQLVYVR